MRVRETIRELRQVARSDARCIACNHDPIECEEKGCRLMLQAAEQLELLNLLTSEQLYGEAEKHEVFRRGQMDMRDRAFALLSKAADNTHGLIQATLRVAAGAIKDLEVLDE